MAGRERSLVALAYASILLAAVEVARLAPFWRHASPLIAWLLVAGVGWAAALWLARRGAPSFGGVVAGALVLRLVALASFPELSDDLYRYVWEGARVLEGTSPYAFAPGAPELEAARAAAPELFAHINHPDVSAAYPPLTQYACAAVVALARALEGDAAWLLRAFFATCDLLVLWPLASLLKRAGLPRGLCVAWGWCPLVTLEFAGSGHFDSLGILLLMAALALTAGAARGRREVAGLVALAGAVVVKYLPLVALPFVARGQRPWRRVAVVLGLVAASFVPFFLMRGGGGGFTAGLGEYGLRWESGSLVQRHLEPLVESFFTRDEGLLDSRRVTRALLGLAWLAVGALAWRRRHDAPRATGALLGAFLVLSPTLHPWYVTWIVPFLALRPRASWAWLVLAIPATYAPLARWKTEGVWEVSTAASWFVALPFFAALVYEARRARRSGDTP